MRFQKNNPVKKFALWILILSFWIGGCASENAPEKEDAKIDLHQIVRGETISYNGITPGISGKKDVIRKRGEPAVIRAFGDYESLHYLRGWDERYLLINGKVHTITIVNHNIFDTGKMIVVKDIPAALGQPALVSPVFGGKINVYPDFGIALSEEWPAVQVFAPSSLSDYRRIWGTYPLNYDPFFIPSVEEAGIIPGTTPRDELRERLGDPDWISETDKNQPWIYELEPDCWGSLDIFFTSNNRVDTMAISSIYKRITFEDIVRRYGQPDILELLPTEEGKAYGGQGLVYLKRGFRAAGYCQGEVCKMVQKENIIDQKLYFTPMSKEDYIKGFRVGIPEIWFVEWQGFAD